MLNYGDFFRKTFLIKFAPLFSIPLIASEIPVAKIRKLKLKRIVVNALSFKFASLVKGVLRNPLHANKNIEIKP